ncbi:ATP-binding response regulator [Phormidium nigroviride]
MSIPNPTLQNFIEPVPLCFPTARLSAVRSIFRQAKCDRVAVVNDLQQPLGLVYLRSLMFVSPVSDRRSGYHAKPLSELNFIVEPMLAVSALMSLSDFWLWLRQQHSQAQLKNQEKNGEFNYLAESRENWGLESAGRDMSGEAIADFSTTADLLPAPNLAPIALIEPDSGKFLGLLDSLQLLKFMAFENSNKGEIRERVAEAKTIKIEEQTGLRYRSAPRTPNIAPLVERPNVAVPGNVALTLNSFGQLLEQLPLPLRLLSNDGQIITQNAAWKSLLGAGPEPALQAAETGSNSAKAFSHSSASVSRNAGNSVPEDGRNWGGTALAQEDSNCSGPACAIAQPLAFSTSTAPSWCAIAAKPDNYTCTSPAHQGKDRTWQFVKQPLSETLTLVLAQDVTEEQLVAKELAAKNADLIQLNRLKDEFLACISHELKTPLTAVLGLSSLLKDRAIGELNDRQARYAKLIHQSGRHLMTVVNDILDLTRMETGQMELIVEPVQIAAVCDRAFEGAKLLQQQEDKPTAARDDPTSRDSISGKSESQIDFTLEIEPELVHIVADELRLRQMLVNLLSNALKFTAAGAAIGLKVNHWEGWIAFTVWDTGIGIPADKQHLIFQKFQQLESPLTRRFQGTGLGLVLTQRLARLHGGDVSFISSEGQGSQFTLLLPPCPPGKTDGKRGSRGAGEQGSRGAGEIEDENLRLVSSFPRPRVPPLKSSSAGLVLIVEAVPRFIEDLSNLLTNLGYRVIVARSGTEALEKARRFSPEVIFINPLLPLLSGWDVLTLLKTDADTCSIPAIVTATRGEKERAKLNRADGFLSLPVKESTLLEQLRELTRAEQPTADAFKSSLTVLLLSPLNSSFHAASFLVHPSYCRILEADDLDQAELLARIWHPNVMVLEGTTQLQNPSAFVEELSRRSSLVSIPLVTLDSVTTSVANQVKGLSVFPCLAAGDRNAVGTADTSQQMPSALWQVIQVAAGITCKPSILLVDVSSLSDLLQSAEGEGEEGPEGKEGEISGFFNSKLKTPKRGKERSHLSKLETPNCLGEAYPQGLALRGAKRGEERSKLKPSLPTPNSPSSQVTHPPLTFPIPNSQLPVPNSQALIQYLQTAGFRGAIAGSWAEVLQQLQYQSVDLLLICLREDSSPSLVQALSKLRQMPAKPPILVLDYRCQTNRESPAIDSILGEIAAQLLSSSLSVAQLLQQIEQSLNGSYKHKS